MTPSKDLFELIKSLDKGEKTYFKRFARHNYAAAGSKYTLLFDAINAQGKYDEGIIIKKFKGKIFANQFPVAKNYLFNTILKSLRAFHKNQRCEVHDQLHNAEIFYEKGFLKQSHKALLKAKKIAEKYELYEAMPELFRMEEKISVNQDDMDHLKSIRQEKTAAFAVQENTQAYRDINFNMLSFHRKFGKAREKRHLEEMRAICNSKLMQNESYALSLEAKCRFHETWYLYFYVAGNLPRVSTHLEKIIDIYHKNPEKISGNFDSYLIYFGNLILATLEQKNYEKAEEYLGAMQKTIQFAKTQMQKAKFYYEYNSLLLGHLNDAGNFSKAVAMIPAIAKDLEKYGPNLSQLRKSIILINISLAYFGSNQYGSSIAWINRIRNEISFTTHPDLQTFCSVFYLIVNFEAGKNELLPYLIKSTYRMLSKKEQLYKFEIILLSFLGNDLPKINTKKELREAFRKLKTKLIPLEKAPHEKNVFTYFDYISWLESKIKNRSFAEVLRAKVLAGTFVSKT